MKSFTKFEKVLIGIGSLTSAATFYYLNYPNKTAYTSWTTNYEPNIRIKWDENWDHRSPKSLVNPKLISKDVTDDDNRMNESFETAKSKAIRHVILIRHGQYNLDGKSDEERVLTEMGRIQADYTGKRLKELGLPYTKLVKSTMSRAQETGSIISQSLPQIDVENCPLLREGAPVPPEPPIGSWKQEKHFYVDGARIEAAFRKYFHRAEPKQDKDTYTVLVCHANVIRYFVCRALQFPSEGWLRLSLNHGSITWISIYPSGRVILRNLGETGYMPPNIITSH